MGNKILGAQERICTLEFEIFSQIRRFISDKLAIIQLTAGGISAIDALCSMAEVSSRNRYCMPEITLDSVIDIKGKDRSVHTGSVNAFAINGGRVFD